MTTVLSSSSSSNCEDDEPTPSPPHTTKERRSSWKHTVFLVIADIVGTGVLELGGNLARIGWLPGILAMLFFFVVNTYTGLLLVRVRNVFPAARNYGDMASFTFGPLAGSAIRGVVYLTLLMNLGSYLLVVAHTMRSLAFSVSATWCSPVTVLLAAGVLLPFNQVRTLHHVSYLACVSFVTILVAVGGTLAVVVHDGRAAAVTTELVRTEGGFFGFFEAFSGFVFAFAGQTIYLEMMSEMKRPREFKKALKTGMPTIAVLYALTSFLQYAYTGTGAKSFLLDNLPDDNRKIVIYSFMFVHMLISYTITQVVLSRALHARLWAHTANEHGTFRSSAHHFLCSSALLVAAYVIANAVPFFDNLTGIIGSLFLAPLAMVLPCAAWLRTVSKQNAGVLASLDVPARLPRREKAWLWVVIAVGVLVTVLGTVANVRSTYLKSKTGFGAPFSCTPSM